MVNISQLAAYIGVVPETIERYYRYAKKHPEDERFKMLPKYVIGRNSHNQKCRLWEDNSVDIIKSFRESIIKRGRAGFMGEDSRAGNHSRRTKYGKKKN